MKFAYKTTLGSTSISLPLLLYYNAAQMDKRYFAFISYQHCEESYI